ncbi:MAG: hypothetical protein E7208_03905 [Clostridium butyricum]|nr:hypothetical protein [Clostridium butyricum]
MFRACGLGNINSENFKSNSDDTTHDGNFQDSTTSNENTEEKTTHDGNAQDTGAGFNFGCNDIPGGFQNVNPELFIVVAEILGNVMAGNMPFNVQNAVGNWLELVGQVILTYNAQQQYFQGGPGRYFNPIYYNVSNPFCNTTGATSRNGTSGCENDVKDDNYNKGQNNKTSKKYSEKHNRNKELKELKDKMETLISQIEEIREEISDIKNG